MIVLVCGGRNYRNRDHVFFVLSEQYRKNAFTKLVHGGATGADALADEWAKANGVPIQAYRADWDDLDHADAVIRVNSRGKKYDAKAGHRRNKLMLEKENPDLVIGFAGGPGTADMLRLAAARAKVNEGKPGIIEVIQ
jgi:hypothetical protein